MPKWLYKSIKFSAEREKYIRQANEIIEIYQNKGFSLTLRQLYYQFVTRNWIANTDQNYKKLGTIISDAREAGRIDWSAIEDRTRSLQRLGTWDSPSQIVKACADSYRENKWADQGEYVEVWVEKEALAGILDHACSPLEVPYFACKGNPSTTSVWEAGQRLTKQIVQGKRVNILYLGDHDPTGLDINRDIGDRLFRYIMMDLLTGRVPWPRGNQERLAWTSDHVEMFQQHKWNIGKRNVDLDQVAELMSRLLIVTRIALNYDQVEKYSLPPNPAKTTDSRSKKYIEEFGESSWELDALDPAVMAQMIEDGVLNLRDDQRWEQSLQREEDNREILADAWRYVKEKEGK